MMEIPVYLVAVAFLGMGLVALAKPAFVGDFFDVRFDSVNGRNEVRAVYGGFGIAMAAALVIATGTPEWRAGILVAVGLGLAGMAAGRLFSALIERPGFWPWFYCTVEAAGAGILLRAAGVAGG